MLKLKYQGQEKSRSRQEATFKETFIGKENEIDEKISSLQIGSFTNNKGFLTNWRKTQQDGVFYNLEIEYTINYGSDSGGDNSDPEVYGRKSANLSVRSIQLPLEKHPKYLAKWNNYLFSSDATSPSFWNDAKSTTIDKTFAKTYKWGKSPAECPEGWVVSQEPTKPGVEVYDWQCYVVTISQKHNSANSAGNTIQKRINKITSPAEDFGIDGGDWKLDDCSVSYNGKSWVSTMTYTRSGDEKGWDKDIYGEA